MRACCQKGGAESAPEDIGATAFYSKLYEARDAIASSSGTIGTKARVDRRHMAVEIVDENMSTLVAKLVDGKMRWLPSLSRLDKTLTKEFMADNFGL